MSVISFRDNCLLQGTYSVMFMLVWRKQAVGPQLSGSSSHIFSEMEQASGHIYTHLCWPPCRPSDSCFAAPCVYFRLISIPKEMILFGQCLHFLDSFFAILGLAHSRLLVHSCFLFT